MGHISVTHTILENPLSVRCCRFAIGWLGLFCNNESLYTLYIYSFELDTTIDTFDSTYMLRVRHDFEMTCTLLQHSSVTLKQSSYVFHSLCSTAKRKYFVITDFKGGDFESAFGVYRKSTNRPVS